MAEVTEFVPDWGELCWQQPAQEHALAQWALCHSNETARELQMSMNLDDAYPSRWLRAADLGNKTHRVTIASVDIETFQDGTSKPVLAFQGRQKGMVLNKTNATSIASSYGKNMLAWVGKDIEIFSMKVQGPSGLVDGIRVRVPEGASPSSGEPEPAGTDLDDDIPF